ncbi:hypothetical protein [Streptomyces chilikensis]|uniref:Peptidoglycan binding domain-containing protein n=1 Tax=Streptomyces chilikensis TaxID=1194079 RepID=A0ABV3EKM0_9ACTN
MSRETDSPSPTPSGHGGSAHPSEPSRPEDRKTETTLTTRVKINIPGSRPIPPVVVRKPVGDGSAGQGEQPSAGGGATPADGTDTSSAASAAGQPSDPPAPAKEKTSDWFAPRKAPVAPPESGPQDSPSGPPALPGPSGPSAQGGAPGQGGAPASGGQGRTPAAGAPALPQRPTASRPAGGAPAGGAPVGGAPAGRRPGGAPRPGGAAGAPGAPRPGGTNGSGLPGATGGPVAPGHGGGTGSVDVTEALNAGPLGPRGGQAPGKGPTGQAPAGQVPGGQVPGRAPGQSPRPQAPTGPTGGPVTGSGPLGTGPLGTGPGGGLSDDTAVLTPQRPAPEAPGAPGAPRRQDNISGDTLTSGIPRVPAAGAPPEGAAYGGPAGPPPGAHRPAAAAPAPAPAPASAPPARKKGRNKLVLLGGGLVALFAVAYGAGLLLNHSDVPKGTTVLGVEIGGGTREEAAQKLDRALGDRVDQPLKFSVDGEAVSLEPERAGLEIDTRATVGEAAKSDYNPVSVIGSLLGQERVVEPNMPVDSEKLRAALEESAGGAGSVTEGGIEFSAGKAVPVYGKPGKGIDMEKAVSAVKEAYRKQVATGSAPAVELPVATREPSVPDAEVDRMMKEFAEPAMSGLVTVQTDAARAISFSPEKSLWRFLRVRAVDGRLVESYDKAELEKLYGETFDGVLITRATGKKTPVTVEDVIGALRPALVSRTERTGVIDTDPS